MSLLWSKNGFRGEYLARYFVSRFAFISESSVGEDYGIDFYCGLIKDCLDKKYVHYDKPFLLQIKTSASKANIEYKTENSINTLYNLDLPFFIGNLNLENNILEIFSTSMMWHTYLITGLNDITRITFRHRHNDNCGEIHSPIIEDLNFKDEDHKFGNLKNNIVDLGHPLIRLKLSELDTNPELIEKCRTILSKCIDKENANILNKRLKLYYYRWIHSYNTNNPDSIKFGYNFLGPEEGIKEVNPLNSINNLNHYLISLALAFKETGDEVNYENVCKLTRLISIDNHLENIKTSFPEIYFNPI